MFVCEPVRVASGATSPDAATAKIVTLGEVPSFP
jgi:hypothetical protein